ncbi:MAG: type IV pilin [Candidatus Thermoplasmatota archaeon]
MVTNMVRKALARDENGVSPVIGTILMVAVTVALAATVLTVMNAYGNKAPAESTSANFKANAVDTNNDGATDAIKLTYIGGPANITAQVSINNPAGDGTMAPTPAGTTWNAGDFRIYDAASSAGTWFVTVSVLGDTVLDSTIVLDQ